MTNYTAEQVAEFRDSLSGHALTVAEKATVLIYLTDYAELLRERESAKPVAGCLNVDGKLCDPFMAADVIDETLWSEPVVVPLYTHTQRESASVVPEAGGKTWQHASNEWADAATNGLQYMANVRDGITTFDEAFAGLKSDIEHARSETPSTLEAKQ